MWFASWYSQKGKKSGLDQKVGKGNRGKQENKKEEVTKGQLERNGIDWGTKRQHSGESVIFHFK